MRTALRAAIALVLALAGCGDEPARETSSAAQTKEVATSSEAQPSEVIEPGGARAPANFRASVVLEPPRIEIGDTFTVEIAVVTPPEHRVAPAPVPKALAGLWILEAERPSLDREPGRWVHHQRFRARARATGPFMWPALELGVEGPTGSKQSLSTPERPFEVTSLLAEHPERRSFFSYRAPPLAEVGGSGPWLPALLGALFALAGVALFAFVRRVRSARTDAAPGDSDATGSGAADDAALAAFAHAESALGDPVRAADLASEALRGWAAARARTPSLQAASTEELAARAAPFLIATRYAPFLALVHELDALRFPPPQADRAALARDAIARAAAFVARSRVRS
jgi:hypothetical protein